MNSRLAWRVAVRDSELDATAKHVALTLDIYMNRRGVAWPSRSSLAAGTGRSTKTVDRAVAHLEQAGFLMVVRSSGRRANRYHAVIPNRVPDVAVVEALTGTLATATGTFGTRNSGPGVPLSRKEAVIRTGKADRARDQNQTNPDPAMADLAHQWLEAHTR